MRCNKFLCCVAFIIVMTYSTASAYEYIGYAEAIQSVQIRPEISRS